MPEQQIVEIAKAIGVEARVVIMDEPTASLTDREVENLFAVVGRCASHGVGRRSTFRTGSTKCSRSPIASRSCATARPSRTEPASSLTRRRSSRMMVGRELSAVFPKRPVTLGPIETSCSK